MFRCVLVAASALVFSIPLAAQEPLWSATMTAGTEEVDGSAAVGYNRNPTGPSVGGLSDPDFVFDGTTHDVYTLAQFERHELGEWVVLFAFRPPLDRRELGLMTLTVDGRELRVGDALVVGDNPDDNPPWSGVLWGDPGFRWAEGQRVDVGLTAAQPVPALPAVGSIVLALLRMGAARRCRKGR